MVRNQLIVVPKQAAGKLTAYFGNRKGLMQQIEQEDVRQLNRPQGVTKTK
jgi:hypothetical protein